MGMARYFIDTSFVQALLNQRDKYHATAIRFLPIVREASEVWTTEAILVEVGNALSELNRSAATRFIRQAYETPNLRIVSVDTTLLRSALDLYASRHDKSWGLTDCISFVVMRDQQLSDALTTDRHFTQAGFSALLAE
jgi:hypothetical protein